MNFDYKKYSLENLEKWIEDAINSSEASPQEIYDVIKNVVKDNYYCYKNSTERCYELLALLNGNGGLLEQVKAHGELWDREDKKLTCDKDDKSPECQKAWSDFWEENYYPEEYYKIVRPSATQRDIDQYTEEELNAMCDKAALDEEKNKCREYNLREVEYYDKRAKFDAVSVISPPLYVSEDGDIFTEEPKKDKVVKWQLPVEVDGPSGEYFVCFPDDLLLAANLKEGDTVEWVDQGNGSFLLRKIVKPLGIDEC